jgi:RND family efflux transporter MFP subunit
MRQKIVYILLVLSTMALGLLLYVKVNKRLDSMASLAKEAEAKQATQTQKVAPKLVHPEAGPATEQLHLTGTLKPDAEVSLGFKVPGRVLEIGVKRGDVVKKGDFLARLDARDLQAQADQAHAGKRAAEAQKSIASDALRRAKQLAEAGAATEQQVFAASGQTNAISASIEQAGAAQRYIEVIQGETRMLSPIDGVVTNAPSAPGFVVQVMSAPVVTIQRLSILKFVGHLTDKDAARVQTGMAIHLESEAGVTAEGKLDTLIPSVDMLTRRVPIEATVPNADGKLFAGSMVDATVQVQAEASLVVPVSCLLTGEQPSVLVLGADRKLERRAIRVLRTDKDKLLVRSGLAVGDTVLANPGVDWREGETVPGVK